MDCVAAEVYSFMDASHGRSRKGAESRISPVEGSIVVFGESETIVPGPLCVLHLTAECSVRREL